MAVAIREPAYRSNEPRSILAGLMPPVEIEGDSVVFHPARMITGEYYLAVLRDEPYLYRKVSDTEVQVYGLAD